MSKPLMNSPRMRKPLWMSGSWRRATQSRFAFASAALVVGCLGAAWPAHPRGFDAAIPARTLAKAINMQNVEDNKKVVLTFYNKALNDKDPQAALQYLGAPYVQHNPDAEDGSAGFVKYINFIRQSFPQSHSEIKAAFADGDFVILHVHTVREPGQRGNAIAEFFRLEDGKIVEHWDVIQPVPERSANGNGMF
jgi:predicted SnoaL-like aldol condensation-catalyzing enzyme